MGGDISRRSLRLASAQGGRLYVRNNSNETHQTVNIIDVAASWEAGLLKDTDEFNNNDPNFRIR